MPGHRQIDLDTGTRLATSEPVADVLETSERCDRALRPHIDQWQ